MTLTFGWDMQAPPGRGLESKMGTGAPGNRWGGGSSPWPQLCQISARGLPWWLSGKKNMLPMQEAWVQSLTQGDPTGHGSTKPMRHHCWACALEPGSHNYWSPCSATRKATTMKNLHAAVRVEPRSRHLKKNLCSSGDPVQPKMNKFKKTHTHKLTRYRGCNKIELHEGPSPLRPHPNFLWCRGALPGILKLAHIDLAAPGHVGSSQTRARICVPHICRWILNHWTIREAQQSFWVSPGVGQSLSSTELPDKLVVWSLGVSRCWKFMLRQFVMLTSEWVHFLGGVSPGAACFEKPQKKWPVCSQ